MKVFPFLGLALAAVLVTAPAYAVDVVNQDQTEAQILVTDNQGSDLMRVQPGESFIEICTKCTINLGGEAMQFEGSQIAVIRDGRLSIKTN
ncbi:MAG: hypothetical protein VW268_05415 [Rhodospirillaceae bacterium]